MEEIQHPAPHRRIRHSTLSGPNLCVCIFVVMPLSATLQQSSSTNEQATRTIPFSFGLFLVLSHEWGQDAHEGSALDAFLCSHAKCKSCSCLFALCHNVHCKKSPLNLCTQSHHAFACAQIWFPLASIITAHQHKQHQQSLTLFDEARLQAGASSFLVVVTPSHSVPFEKE